MIRNKAIKKCRSTGKASGFDSCCQIREIEKYGLCKDCYTEWLLTTPDGKLIIEQTTLRAKRKVVKQVKKETRNWIKEQKEQIKRKSDYEREMQYIVNWIVRAIDSEKGCISCSHGWNEKWTRRQQAGHYHSVGVHSNLRFNVFNIFLQCQRCNEFLSGNIRNYRTGIIYHYSHDLIEYIESLPRLYPDLKLTIPELKDCLKRVKMIKKEILNGKDYTRKQINQIIGIYKN